MSKPTKEQLELLKIGDRINNITVLAMLDGRSTKGEIMYQCKCDCGKMFTARRYLLINRKIMSCGCLRKINAEIVNSKHGMYKTPTYQVWSGIIQRCTNKNHKKYSDYGGRGIMVCKRWFESFENFIEDMGAKPNSNYSIDRIDNDGNYCKDNCRWATWITQQNNKRNNHYITYQGVTKTLKEWSNSLGISYCTLTSRINKSRWSIERSFTTPVKNTKKCIKI